uniref:Uncharacterized protein n=1 Tax=Populus trichocarpa TaxID=3694 RepID=A0A2K1ZRQ2_POPTR
MKWNTHKKILSVKAIIVLYMCANRHNPRFFRKVVTMPIIFEKQTKKKQLKEFITTELMKVNNFLSYTKSLKPSLLCL